MCQLAAVEHVADDAACPEQHVVTLPFAGACDGGNEPSDARVIVDVRLSIIGKVDDVCRWRKRLDNPVRHRLDQVTVQHLVAARWPPNNVTAGAACIDMWSELAGAASYSGIWLEQQVTAAGLRYVRPRQRQAMA